MIPGRRSPVDPGSPGVRRHPAGSPAISEPVLEPGGIRRPGRAPVHLLRRDHDQLHAGGRSPCGRHDGRGRQRTTAIQEDPVGGMSVRSQGRVIRDNKGMRDGLDEDRSSGSPHFTGPPKDPYKSSVEPHVDSSLHSVESPWTSHEQLRAFVRYSLSQLRNRNEHHRFEHLCEALARQRITPNILVGSGPVSSGGDQGRDFETFRAYTHGHVRDLGTKIGLRDNDTIVFCCTVGQSNVPKKIESDLKKLAAGKSDVDIIVYFSEQDVPVATRHKLITKARTEHGIRLEILDGQTLTALLCDRDTFWIAVEFLDVPVHLAPEEPGPEWYSTSRARWLGRKVPAATGGDVIELSACARFATFNEAFRGDVSLWLDRLIPLLRDDVDPILRRRVRYEIIVATYRGLGDLRPADNLVRLALSDATLSTSAEELDSAEILHQYAQGAWLYDVTSLSADELAAFGERLEQQLVFLLGSTTVLDRRCRLLVLIGRVRLRMDLHALAARMFQRGKVKPPPPMTDQEWERLLHHLPTQRSALPDVVDADGAMMAWLEAAKILKKAPLFPIQAFAESAAVRAPYLSSDPRWPEFVAQLDSQVAAAVGRQAVASLARSRSMSLLMAGIPFAALNELHRAREALMQGDTRYQGAEALLDAARVYEDLGLLYAAKHYALAAGAVTGDPDSDGDKLGHPIVATGLIAAAHSDFMAGNWFSLLAWLPHIFSAHVDLREAADEPGQWPDLVQILACVHVVTKVVDRLGDARLKSWLNSRLEAMGVDSNELANTDMNVLLSASGNDVGVTSITTQLGQAPFADTGSTRMIRFEARGLRWRIRTRNTFDDVRAAERLAAAIQIIMAALENDDLVLVESTLEVRVKTVRPRQNGAAVARYPKATGRAPDGAHRWEAVLTRDLGPYSVDFHAATSEVVGVAMTILLSMSLLPWDSLEIVIERLGKEGTLIRAVFPHIRYDRAYAVLSPEDFAEQDGCLFSEGVSLRWGCC